jgi:hypothetical protein
MKTRRRKPYENNPWYKIIDGILYFVLPGGKKIIVRKAQPYDYGDE